MNAQTWTEILHDIATITATLAAAIAAGSSLVNGKTLKKNHKILTEAVHQVNGKPPKNTTSSDDSPDDWYKPPSLWS